MKQIHSFDLKRFRTEEDFGFQSRVVTLMQGTLALESDQAMVETYAALVAAFDEALKAAAKNTNTATLTAADEEADRLWSYSRQYVRAMTGYPDEAVAAMAGAASDCYDKYGNINDLGYDEEYGRYHNLLQDLNALGEEKLTALGLTPWLTAMTAAKDAVLAARESKVAEEAGRQTGIVKESRTAADEGYKAMVQRVNALVIVNGEGPYVDFIDRLNVMLAEANATLKARATNAAKKAEEAESLPK